MTEINKINVSGINYNIASNELTKITYAQLKDLRDNNQLKEGHFYRIIDYSGPTDGAKHKFDIIVQALSTNTLSENAQAIQSEDDTYFINNNLSTWELKYSIDIDDDRFRSPYFIFKGVMINDPQDSEQTYNNNVNLSKTTPYWSYTIDPSTDKETITLFGEFKGVISQDDRYFYRGVVVVDNIEYDCWQKWELTNIQGANNNGFFFEYVFGQEEVFVYYLSTRVVFNNEVIFPRSNGIIYYMKDEFNNCASYDFKNILFNNNYTFSSTDSDGNIIDYSLVEHCNNNKIGTYTLRNTNGYENSIVLNNIILEADYGEPLQGNVFKHGCFDIVIKAPTIIHNLFDIGCRNINLMSRDRIFLNKFGSSCDTINSNDRIEFSHNIFGNNCYEINMNGSYNVFEESCRGIEILSDYNEHNIFKYNCQQIYLNGSENYNNIFEAFCYNIKLNNNCTNLRFGTNVERIVFNQSSDLNNIQFKSCCNNITINNISTDQQKLQNVIIDMSVSGTEVSVTSGVGAEHIVSKNSEGEIVEFYLADLIQ